MYVLSCIGKYTIMLRRNSMFITQRSLSSSRVMGSGAPVAAGLTSDSSIVFPQQSLGWSTGWVIAEGPEPPEPPFTPFGGPWRPPFRPFGRSPDWHEEPDPEPRSRE